jgi:hypothetical protein
LPLLFVTGATSIDAFCVVVSKIIVWFLDGRGACSDVSWIFVLMWDLPCTVTWWHHENSRVCQSIFLLT